MAFEFLSLVTSGATAAAKEFIAVVVVWEQSGVSWLIYVGQLIYVIEMLLGVAAIVFCVIGLLYCCRRNALCSGSSQIDEQGESPSDEQSVLAGGPPEQNAEVTVRLEGELHWLLRRHRCVVTVQAPLGGNQVAGQEVWYASGGKSNH